ncbi:MAG: aminotransferase class IV [Acidobacteriota bacterium]
MPELANINGEVMPVEQACLPAEDRGTLFGDGVYEVLRSYEGRLWAVERHFQRLQRSLTEIAIENLDLARIQDWVVNTYRQSQIGEATVYLQITRGAGPRSHAWNHNLTPTVFLTVRHFTSRADAQATGVQVVSLPDTRWARCDIKSLNLLPNVMAKQKARNAGAYEAIFVDKEGLVREGTSSAVVTVLDGVLCAPPNSHAILPSITRQLVWEMAEDLGIPFREESTPLERLYRADEAFLAGTGDEVLGIVQTDGRMIGNGRPGSLTGRLFAEYRHRIARQQDQLRV